MNGLLGWSAGCQGALAGGFALWGEALGVYVLRIGLAIRPLASGLCRRWRGCGGG